MENHTDAQRRDVTQSWRLHMWTHLFAYYLTYESEGNFLLRKSQDKVLL